MMSLMLWATILGPLLLASKPALGDQRYRKGTVILESLTDDQNDHLRECLAGEPITGARLLYSHWLITRAEHRQNIVNARLAEAGKKIAGQGPDKGRGRRTFIVGVGVGLATALGVVLLVPKRE